MRARSCMSKPSLDQVASAWDDALKRLQAATVEYETAAASEGAARSDTTRALNALNAIQNEMDRLDADLRAAMPSASDWRKRRSGNDDPERSR